MYQAPRALRVSLFLLLPLPILAAEPLTFEARVRAQEAIERVYYAHQAGARLPFHEAVPREILERKVRTYLRQSDALDRRWNTPVTAAALRRELERIARNTRTPERLQQIYDALGRDPIVIQECFARPALVARLVRGFSANDPPGPVSSRDGGVVPRHASVPHAGTDEEGGEPVAEPLAVLPGSIEEAEPACPADDTWNNGSLDDVPEGRSHHAAVWTGTEMIVWGGDRASGWRYDPLLDTWAPISTAAAPTALGPAVWTGSEMIVWGTEAAQTAGRYDPATDTWQPVASAGAPVAGRGQTVLWSGAEMIVWRGLDGASGRYDPFTDSWSTIATMGAPSPRELHAAVWTGSLMLIWGGYDGAVELGDGARYDPATDSWSPMTALNAPSARLHPVAVWTGSEMLVWSGRAGVIRPRDGGRYDATMDTWAPITSFGAPEGRDRHKAVWTGAEMIVWGGRTDAGTVGDGGRFDPQSGLWADLTTGGAPAPRESHTALWDGTRMMVWGGTQHNGVFRLDSGGRYDPGTDSWTPTSVGDAPEGRFDHAAVWTGNFMVIWGGRNGGSVLGDGRYDPLLDAWAPVSTVGAPAARLDPIAIWTGRYMLVYAGDWGVAEGGRYDPVADTWLPVSPLGAFPRFVIEPQSAWTGSRMAILGYDDISFDGHAGFYDPETDTWEPIAFTGGPSFFPLRSTLVWTGTHLLHWGGSNGSAVADTFTGYVYDPETATWGEISRVGAPEPRLDHDAFWTGTHMLVWGGTNHAIGLTTGGLYDPVSDSWIPLANDGVPLARRFYSAVWTGNRLLVWGGTGPGVGSSGAVYDLATDTWTPTSTAGAPAARTSQTAVWTGGEMIVWGGGSGVRNGGRYALGQHDDFDADGFSHCDGDCDDLDAGTHPGAAEVCDGRDNDCDGVLAALEEVDADFDGAPLCNDCNDASALQFPGRPETCDTVDNDCDGTADSYVSSCGVGACAASGFCAAGVDDCTPGVPSPEICDGVDNDCDGTLLVEETDLDGDGIASCFGDCDDADAATFPGALEVNDGRDNDCPGDHGFGLTDEIDGAVDVRTAPPEFCWPAQPGATAYEALRSPVADFSSGCVSSLISGTCWADPAPLGPSEVAHYLARPVSPHAGDFGPDSTGGRRSVCGFERLCDDQIDDDGDGLSDCADTSDCYAGAGCTSATFRFVDTAGDDVPAQLLEQFLAGAPLGPTDYIHFRVGGGGIVPFEWCQERADFYRDSYLSLAAVGGTALSGDWDRWHQTDDGGWVGPVSGAFPNLYGASCAGAYSWCSELGLEGDHLLVVAPGETGTCEAFDNAQCAEGAELVITVGVDRPSVCGF